MTEDTGITDTGDNGDDGAADTGVDTDNTDTGAADAADKDSTSNDTKAKDTGDSGDADKTADDDKTKKNSDEDAEKSKTDDDKGDDDEGTNEPYTAESFELPEGVEVDESMMGEFLEIANDKELSGKDRDQALVSLYAKKQQDAMDAQYQSWDDQRITWKNEAKVDKEIGGKEFDKNLAHANKALAHFGSKELKEFGEQYGFVDNPEYLRMMVRVGKTLAEDNSSGNHGSGDSQTPIENRWYGSSDKKNQ